MTSREFARKWLEKQGMFDKDSDFDGWIGETVMEVWNFIADQGHSGGSAAMLFACLDGIRKDYDDENSVIWQEYWQSDAGKALVASFHGQ